MVFNLQRMRGIIRKELLVLFGNPMMRFLLIIPAVAQLFIFGYAASLDVKNISFGILNDDHGKWSDEIIQSIAVSAIFTEIHYAANAEEVQRLLDTQEVMLVLHFDSSFSRNIEAGKPAQYALLIDGRRSNAAQIASGYIADIINRISKDTPLEKNINIPRIDVSTVHWFNPNLIFQWFVVPALIGLISIIMSLIISGLSVAREKELGTFDQILVSPATPLEIGLAKLVPGCLIAVFQGSIFIVGSIYLFNIPLEGSVFLLYLAMIIFSLGASGIGMFLSALVSTQQQAFLSSFTVAFPCILLSGFVAPISNMPIFLQYLSKLDPLSYFMTIVHGIFLKDSSTEIILYNIAMLFLIAVVSLVFSMLFFKRKL